MILQGYYSVEQVDRAIAAQVRFYALMASAAEHVAPELQAVCIPPCTSVGDDPLIDELLEARLRLTRMAQTRTTAMKKLTRKVTQEDIQTRVQ